MPAIVSDADISISLCLLGIIRGLGRSIAAVLFVISVNRLEEEREKSRRGEKGKVRAEGRPVTWLLPPQPGPAP